VLGVVRCRVQIQGGASLKFESHVIQWISKMYARIVASTHPTKKYRGAIKNQIDVPTTHYPPPQCLENVP